VLDILKESQLKRTIGREVILSVIKSSSLPLTAEDIYKQVIANHNVNLSTIYRTLNTLTKKNILLKQVRQDGITYYQLNKHEHKHILMCTSCGKEITINKCPFTEINKAIENQTGYVINNHNIEIFGVCPKCNKKGRM
jgi:Fur family ferric uptake transcriptional regulator